MHASRKKRMEFFFLRILSAVKISEFDVNQAFRIPVSIKKYYIMDGYC